MRRISCMPLPITVYLNRALARRRHRAYVGVTQLLFHRKSASDHEASCGIPMRTLHQRGLDKRQTPNPGEAQVDLTRFQENIVKFRYRTLGSIYDSRR